MATHRTFKSLGKKLTQIAARQDANLIDTLRKAATAINNVAIITTPVDTGYARSRWTVTIGTLPAQDTATAVGVQVGEEVATAIAIASGDKVIKEWTGDDSLFVSNPVHYSVYLDAGSSEQAPEGITDQAIAAGREVLENARLLD